MKNTIDAIKYGLETMNITPKEMFSLIESSNGYDGDDYKRWLSNEIIKLAEKDGIGYSQLLAKWFNIIQSIIEEYADESIKECYNNKILDMIKNTSVYTVGISEENNNYGVSLDEIEWGSKVDLPYNLDFIESLPTDLGTALSEDKGVTFFVRFNPKSTFKKNCDLVVDAKMNGISIKNQDALMMYRMCTIVRALEDMCSNFKFVFMADTSFLYNIENAEVIKYFLSFFKYTGFVVNSKDLYAGSFTSEEYAICECTPRGISDKVQDGFELMKGIEIDGKVVAQGKMKRYSQGSNMLEALYKESPLVNYVDNVPIIDKGLNVVGIGKGIKSAYGYLCKGDIDRNAVLTSYPIKGTNYIAITDENLMRIISYYGVTQSMDNSGLFSGIDEIIDGHPDYMQLVSNCVPIFLFDINSRFCDLGVVKNKSGKDIRLKNRFDINNSDIVKKLIDKSSVYFSYEAKELMDVCKKYLNRVEDVDLTKCTFEGIRNKVNDEDLNRAYFNTLSRCKDFISSLYRNM